MPALNSFSSSATADLIIEAHKTCPGPGVYMDLFIALFVGHTSLDGVPCLNTDLVCRDRNEINDPPFF